MLMETKIQASSQTFYITLNKGHPHPSQGCICNYFFFLKKVAFNQGQEFSLIIYLINIQQKKNETRKCSFGCLPE